MMPTVEKVLFLKGVPLFAGVPTRNLVQVAGIAGEVLCAPEEPIITEGEQGNAMFLIVEGEVVIHRGEHRLATLRVQDCFGEMSILDNEPRSASATATTDCLLLKVDQDHFHAILNQNADVAMAIIRTLTRRLRTTDVKPATKPDRPPDEKHAG